MNAPKNSLLARAQAYLKNPVAGKALAVAPLAALGLVAHPAETRAAGPALDPVMPTYGPDTSAFFKYNASGGTIFGVQLPSGAVAYQGSASYGGFQPEGSFTGLVGTVSEFSIVNGTGTGVFDPQTDLAEVRYNFTLGAGGFATVTGWTLELSITTSAGTNGTTITDATGAGTFADTVFFPIPGADAGAAVESYEGSLKVSYVLGNDGFADTNDSLSLTIPAGGVVIGAVPEPSTWLILATGVIGTGFQLMRVRQRRPRAVPPTAAA